MTVRRLATAIGVAVLLIAAGLAVATAPESAQIAAPFDVDGQLGQTVTTRQIEVTITEISLSERLEFSYSSFGGGPDSVDTTGVWLIAATTTTTLISNTSFAGTELQIGDSRYRVTTVLPSPSLTDVISNPGVPVEGSLVFELPRSALDDAGAADARVVFRSGFTAIPDSMAVVHLDLSTAQLERTALIGPAAVKEAS